MPPVPPNPPTRVIVGFRAEAPIETLKKYPKDSTALLQRATLEINEGDLGAATADLATLQGMKIFSAALTFQESRIFAARHETAREGDLLAEALHTDPHYLPARLSLAELLVAQGKARNALVILDQADTGQKKSVEYIYSRNMALLATRDWDEARKGVDEGLALRRLPGFYYQDAALRDHTGDLAGARKSIESGLELAPDDPFGWTLLGQTMARQKEYAKYLDRLREAAAKYPAAAPLQKLLGERLALAVDLNGAKGRLSEMTKAHDSAKVRLLLADIEMKKGSSDAAIQDYTAALKMEPSNGLVMNNLAGPAG